MNLILPSPDLTIEGCRKRQARLRDVLRNLDLQTVLISDRRHVFYFTGFWCRPIFNPAVLIQLDGPTVISVPFEPTSALAADQVVVYESAKMATLVEDQWQA